MIIRALNMAFAEADVAAKLRDGLGSVSQLRDMTFVLTDGGVKIGGKFHVGFAIPFETHWTLDVIRPDGRLSVKLANISVGFFGMSADTVRAQVMGALAQKLGGATGVSVENDAIMVDPAALLAAKGIRLEAPVRRVVVTAGHIEVEV